jgi:putative nucleotidyltransferase with HDIG domain
MDRVDKVLERVTELPFSPVTGKILELAGDDRIGAREIARIITQDQAFTARLLKIANSPYYGQARAVTTVTQAVPVLGMNTISSLAMALGSFAYSADDEDAVLTMRELWEHSIGCAIWGRQLARHIGHRGAEETFIAGLLHDMGKAVFYRFFKNEFLSAVSFAEAEGIDLLRAERRFLETDHAKAGATVATKWNLPAVLIHTINYHHRPLSVPENMDAATRKTVMLIHVADALSDYFQIGRGLEIDARAIDPEVWQSLGIDLAMCQDMLGEVQGEVSEFRKICDLFSANKKPQSTAAAAKEPPQNARNEVKKIIPAAPIRTTPFPPVNPPAAPAPTGGHPMSRLLDGIKQLALLAGIENLCQNIAEQAMALVAADAAFVMLPHGNDLDMAGAAGLPQLMGKRFPMDQSLAGWVAKMGEMMVVPNLDRAAVSWEKDLFGAAGFRSHLFLPIDWAGKRIAVLSVHSRPERQWGAEQISLVNAFCGFIAVVLENAGLYRDAEERAKALEELNQELQTALNVKTRFIGKVSHELRSPLCVVIGYANLIAEQTFGPMPKEAIQSVDRILVQSNALLQLLTYMLEVSQLDAGKLTVRHAPVEIGALLDEVAAEAPRLIGDKPIQFETDYRGCRGQLLTDPERLAEVLRHVLANAAKFTEQGKIVLSARVKNKLLDITVADTGIGIDAEQQKIIFEGFRQVDENDTRRFDGMGIGLYLARRILALLGGEISVESELGAGSQFHIRLPCSAAI